MAKRKAYAPFSLTSEAGVAQTPVEGYIDVEQKIYPTVATGTVNENGKWVGVKASDENFIGITRAESIANGGEVLFPDTNDHPMIDMTGFTNLFIALRPTAGGSVGMRSVFGPDTVRFANLDPVNAGTDIRTFKNLANGSGDLGDTAVDANESVTADVWNIFFIPERVMEQKNLQFKITNNVGQANTIEFGYMRVV